MKSLLAFALVLFSMSAFAQQVPTGDKCAKYHKYPRLMTAIQTVAHNAKWGLEEMCTLERIWDIQAETTIVVNQKGEEIPHVRVQLHRESDSCLYMVRDADQVVTAKRCFSTW